MAVFRFHLIGASQSVELEVDAPDIRSLGEMLTRQRFVVGRLNQALGDGVLLGMLIATSRIQWVGEVE
jgi:hypothetical protein